MMGKRYERIYMLGYKQAEADIKFDHKYLEWREAENVRLKELLRDGLGPFNNISERLSWEHRVEQALQEDHDE